MASRSIIGIDTHIGKCNYFCIDRRTGEILGVGEFKTSATNFIKEVRRYPEARVVIVEQGPLSGWIERILEGHTEEVIVADTKRNAWIAKDPRKSDRMDGEKLVHLYMGGYIKRVISRSREKQELISLVIHYHSLVKQKVRLKNQIGAKFRQGGRRKAGIFAYREESIRRDLRYLWYDKGLQRGVKDYHAQLGIVENQIKGVARRIQKISHRYPEISFLDSFAGIGFVGSATLSALIDVPERFSTVKRLWIYCGYGLEQQSSGGRFKRARITKRGNRYLKCVIGTAVHNIIAASKDNNSYKFWYNENLKKGKDGGKLKASLARKLIKDIWLGWIEFNRRELSRSA